MTAVILTSESLTVSIHPGHGGVIDGLSFRGGPNLLWRTPGSNLDDLSGDLGARGEASIETFDRGILAGGWFPMFPTVGPPGSSRDVWMHGEAARMPWTVTAVDDRTVAMSIRTLDFDIVREVSVLESTARVRMSATNRAPGPRDIAAGEHPCFRRELFAGGTVQIVPALATTGSVADPVAHRLPAFTPFDWPVAGDTSGLALDLSAVPGDADGRHDHVSLTLVDGNACLTSPLLGLRLELSWDATVLPFALLWEHFLPVSSLWSGDVFAIEPATTPWRLDDETREHDGLVRIEPGETLSYSMAVEAVRVEQPKGTGFPTRN